MNMFQLPLWPDQIDIIRPRISQDIALADEDNTTHHPDMDGLEYETSKMFRFTRNHVPYAALNNYIQHANTLHVNLEELSNGFDLVIANPPFNLRGIDIEEVNRTISLPFGSPKNGNANFLFIQQMYSGLKEGGRIAVLLPSAASDAGGSEQAIRKGLITCGAIEAVIKLDSLKFRQANVRCDLWLLQKKALELRSDNSILFVDADQLVELCEKSSLSESVKSESVVPKLIRAYRAEGSKGVERFLQEQFGLALDTSLFGVRSVDEVEATEWSVNPRRYLFTSNHEANGVLPEIHGRSRPELVKEGLCELEHQLNLCDDILHETSCDPTPGKTHDQAPNTKEILYVRLTEIRDCLLRQHEQLLDYTHGLYANSVSQGNYPRTRLYEQADLFVGSKPNYQECSEERVLTVKCVHSHRVSLLHARPHAGKLAYHHRYLLPGDLLLTTSGVGTAGRTAQVYLPIDGCTVYSHICVIRPRQPKWALAIGSALRSLEPTLVSLAVGSTGQVRIPKSRIAALEVPAPTPEIVNLLQDLIYPLRMRLEVTIDRYNALVHELYQLELLPLPSGRRSEMLWI